VDMLWCQVAIELSNHKLKSVVTGTVWPECTPIQDRQTDDHHGNGATIRFFRSNKPSRGKNQVLADDDMKPRTGSYILLRPWFKIPIFCF